MGNFNDIFIIVLLKVFKNYIDCQLHIFKTLKHN